MPVLVQPMDLPALVALINDWGTRPRQVAGLPTPALAAPTPQIPQPPEGAPQLPDSPPAPHDPAHQPSEAVPAPHDPAPQPSEAVAPHDPAPQSDSLPPSSGSRPQQASATGDPSASDDAAPQVTPEVAIAVADRLHPVFAATDLTERIAAVNGILTETAVRPELVATDDTVTGAWRVPNPDHALLASAALAMHHHLLTHPHRIGTCADRQCADVYVDASPAGHRRFCSVTCQNRSRVAAFRERRRS